MTPSDITNLIRKEIADLQQPIRSCVAINKCLVTPTRIIFADHQRNDWGLWLVLEERPDTKDGYKIVFDEDSNEFGLATKGHDTRAVVIGFYGTFVQALEVM